MNLKRSWLALAGWLFALGVAAQEVKLGDSVAVVLAGEAEARSLLATRDEFVRALSPFDRAGRLKRGQEVSESEFLEFASRSARAWLPAEGQRVTAILRSIAGKLAPWKLPLPGKIWLIKTSGEEEGRAAYTRQNAIVIPANYLGKTDPALEDTLVHEVFHVLSRHDPALRSALYRIVGFQAIGEIEYPVELRARKITNPDGVQTGWSITVTNQGEALPVVPILHATPPGYDAVKGGEFFQYLAFRLLVVEKAGNRWQPRLMDGRPQLLDTNTVTGFFEQTGKNTSYVIHPDEVLAVNFVFMINGRQDLPTPRVVEEMRRVFGHYQR
jgi:hypothetical protein